jgi:hypothetical protein
MTYEELLNLLQQLSEEQLNKYVVIYDKWEEAMYPVSAELVFANSECEDLDLDHPIIRF